jgi:hypothetical protein
MTDHRFNGPLARLMRQRTPDPWSLDVDRAMRGADAVPLCTNCLYPQDDGKWFCPHCDFPGGEYVATMPYLLIFPMGELLRRGVIGPPEKGFGLKLFFVLYSLAQYSLFAPIYWYWMARKASGRPICQAVRKEIPFEDIA